MACQILRLVAQSNSYLTDLIIRLHVAMRGCIFIQSDEDSIDLC